MKDIKDFDVNQFMPEGLATETTTTDVGGDAQPSKRSVSSGHSELTERNGATERTLPTPQSEIIEETVPTLPNGEIAPIPLSGQTARSRQTVSTSATGQSVPGLQTVLAQSTEPPQPPQPTPAQPSRVSSRQRRASLDEYREVFLHIPKIIDRRPVFVSRTTRDKIDGVVRRLGERKMSVSGFLENLARHHLDLYADDLEQWKRL